MNNIAAGSIVTPNYAFERERKAFPQYNYPYPGMLMIVGRVGRDSDNNRMLWFTDFDTPIPLAAVCFEELQDSIEGNFILNEVYNIIEGMS